MVTAKSAPKVWLPKALLIAGMAGALLQLVADVGFGLVYTDVIPTARLGLETARCDADQFCRVTAVNSGGAVDLAGIKVGDQLRMNDPIDLLRSEWLYFRSGDQIEGTLRRGGASSQVKLIAAQGSWTGGNLALEISDLTGLGVQIAVVMIGILLLLRARGRISAQWLGAGLIFMNSTANVPVWLWNNRFAFSVCYALTDALNAASPLLLLGFALAFRRETTGSQTKFGTITFGALCGITAIWSCVAEWQVQVWRLDPAGSYFPSNLTAASWFSFGLVMIAYGVTFLVLAAGWRDAVPTDRPRYRYIVPALILITTMQILYSVINLFGGWDPTQSVLALLISILPLAGVLLLAYGVLRYRVLDVGFAVNRTLVYGAVSAILLLVFGLTEWAVDHFIPIEGREKNALVDAAIGLVVFLTFHRVRDFIEEGIERLFFSSWHHADAELQQFVREAAFFTEPTALSAGFVQALTRYAGGATAALYTQYPAGYLCVGGEIDGIAPQLARDLYPLVRLRAEPKASEIDDALLPAAILAPMVNRNEVIGFALLGAKPSGEQYRPDEIALIGLATRQIGLDLHALKVEQLEHDAADQRRENTALRSLLAPANLSVS